MKILFSFLLLIIICENSFSQSVKTIEIGDTTLNYVDADFELLAAASEGDTAKINAFINAGANVNIVTWEGVSPLMFAAQNGHLSAVELLIDQGADINKKPYSQIDALMGAVISGHVLVADTLILNGANVNTRNLDGVSPLMYTAAFDEYLLSDVLIFYGAKVNTTDNYGNYPIHFSSFYGNVAITNLLIENGASIDEQDYEGYTPLMIAAQNGHYELVAFLVESGCEINKTNKLNSNALSLAIIRRETNIADFLISNGADQHHFINEKTNQYELAREMGGKQMTQLLADNGAKPYSNFSIRKMGINFDVSWNNRDVMLGGSVNLLEAVKGWEAELGYRTRPAERSVRYELDQQTYYQFWEKRSLLYLGAGKRFNLISPMPGKFFGLFASANVGYTYGSFRGSNFTPDDKIIFIPKGGLFYTRKAFNFKLSAEYMKIPESNIPPLKFTLSVGILFNLIKTKIKTKKEPAL